MNAQRKKGVCLNSPCIGWSRSNSISTPRSIWFPTLTWMRPWIVAVAIWWSSPVELFGVQISTAQEADENEVSIDVQARIERQLGPDSELYVFSRVELPSLKGGTKYRVNLTLVNPYETPIDFSAVTFDCGCGKFETKANELPALGSASFILHLDVPNSVTKSRNITTAKFSKVNTRKPVLELSVSYETNNVFSFTESHAILEIPKHENSKILKLPIVLVPPMSLDQLELKYTDNLRDMNIQIVSNDRNAELPYVQVEVLRNALPRHGLSGEVMLRRIGSNIVSGVLVSIRNQDSFSLRPESIRLSRDNHSEPYEATAILRVNKSSDADSSIATEVNKETAVKEKSGAGTGSETSPQVHLSIDGSPARVSIVRLGSSGLYRLTIRHNGPFEPKSDGIFPVRWTLIVGGEERVIESQAFIPNR